MTKQEKEDIISAWNEVETVQTELSHWNGRCDSSYYSMFSDWEQRLQRTLDLLGDYFTDNEAENHIKNDKYPLIK